MRGDRPFLASQRWGLSLFTPHARGSTEGSWKLEGSWKVYPACAGIDLCPAGRRSLPYRLPRMRGDRPGRPSMSSPFWWFTPHARGSTLNSGHSTSLKFVYPACAGIDLREPAFAGCGHSLPRMRGDRPMWIKPYPINNRFTPHARGSTPFPGIFEYAGRVYPACAGIDPAVTSDDKK